MRKVVVVRYKVLVELDAADDEEAEDKINDWFEQAMDIDITSTSDEVEVRETEFTEYDLEEP